MCCGDGGSPYEFILAEHTHGHTIAMSLCGRERIPTTCYVKLSSAQPFHMYQHIVVNESIVLQNVPENCSQRPLHLCDGQGRYGCLSGPCGVGSSCYKQDLIESSENWIYVDGHVEWRFDLLTLPSNLPDVNLIEIRLDNATYDGKFVFLIKKTYIQKCALIKYIEVLIGIMIFISTIADINFRNTRLAIHFCVVGFGALWLIPLFTVPILG